MSHPLINRPCRVARPTFGDDYPAVICEVLTSGHLIVAHEDGALAVVPVERVTLTDTAHLARVLDPQNATLPRWMPTEEVPVGISYLALIVDGPSTFKGTSTLTPVTARLKRWGTERKAFFLVHPANLPEGI